MSVSISGQNDRAALLSAYQATPTAPPDLGGIWDSTVGTPTPSSSTTTTAAPSGTSGALSDGMSLALLAFGGGAATAAPPGGQNGEASAVSSDDAESGQSAADPQAGLLTDMQSLLASLTGTSTTGTSASGTSAGGTSAGGTSTSGTSGGGTSAGGDSSATSDTVSAAAGGTLLQDLQSVTAAFGTIASTSGTAPAAGPGPGSPPSWSNDISNLGTTAPDGTANPWKPGYTDGFQQQFALSAYNANAAYGGDPATASSLANISV
ncbi:hypothetical protein [Rhodopila sp.]|uniref:hypothetical protein n=1 Tax=Rhodopila sp. TaxID=2480087 RepID=UPI003D0B555C